MEPAQDHVRRTEQATFSERLQQAVQRAKVITAKIKVYTDSESGGGEVGYWSIRQLGYSLACTEQLPADGSSRWKTSTIFITEGHSEGAENKLERIWAFTLIDSEIRGQVSDPIPEDPVLEAEPDDDDWAVNLTIDLESIRVAHSTPEGVEEAKKKYTLI